MREILFKAKTTKKGDDIKEFNNIWVEGDLIESNGKFYIKPKCNIVNVRYEVGACVIMHEVQTDTICRFTGLTDKNGKRIWENDIVKCEGDYLGITRTYTGKVIFREDCCTFLVTNMESMNYEWWCEPKEVIGNKFDNPELLEGSNT